MILTTLFTVLTSGAGGGIFGGILGLFKSSQENKKEISLAEIEMKRDVAEYANATEQRKHDLLVIEKTGQLKLDGIETEAEMEIEVAHQSTLGKATIAEFRNLNTSTWMDNLRASVRPVAAYWFSILFSYMLIWAFWKYADSITPAEGKQILMGLFGTLTFAVTSILSFYFVARSNRRMAAS
jgi:hypothetical protein